MSNHRQRWRGQDLDLFTIVARKGSGQTGHATQSAGDDRADDYATHNQFMEAIPGRHVLRHLVARVKKKFQGRS
jgi:hypothetical protein